MPNHFTLTFFLLRRRDVSCCHSNRDLFTCEDNMLFSHVKISCFRAKAHLVFHWYLYNNIGYTTGSSIYLVLFSLSDDDYDDDNESADTATCNDQCFLNINTASFCAIFMYYIQKCYRIYLAISRFQL